MNIEELEAIADEMSEECGDQIDTLYDTVTLQKDTYSGFIDRLREVIRLAKNEPPTAAQEVEALRNTLREIRNDILGMIQNHRSEDPDSYAHGLLLSIGGACDMALHETKNTKKGQSND